MADVFLSYSQRDRRRAKPVVKALEAAGLSVWWDRQLVGGNEFSKEIRDALDTSRTVVVLWSERSVTSSWVLDEAAAGRNSGRLVPASLDGTEPPLGFGQIHTIDLSRRFPPRKALNDLVASVSAKVDRVRAPAHRTESFRKWPITAAIAAAALLVIATTAMIYVVSAGGPRTSHFNGGAVAIGRFGAITPDRESRAAAGMADESFERIFSTNFIETLAASSAPASALAKADFGLRGSVDRGADNLRLTVHVVEPRSGETLWSTDLSRPVAQSRELGDELAIAVADVLRCSIYMKKRIPEYDSLELRSRILRYCEAHAGGLSQSAMDEAPNLAKVLIDAAPKSAQAHALLANALALRYSEDDATPATLALVRSAIADTLALDSKNGAVRWAMAKIATPSLSLAARERFAREGMRLDPDFFWNRNFLANLMLKVGRIDEGRNLFRLFVADYPLDYLQRGVHAYLLAEAGDLDAARSEFDLVETGRPHFKTWAPIYAVQTELLYGDVQHLKPWLERLDDPPETRACILFAAEARQRGATPPAAAIDSACGHSPDQYAMVQAMFGHTEDALRALDANIAVLAPPGQFGPHWVYARGFEKLRQDQRLIAILAKAGIPQYWLETGKFPDFCVREKLTYNCRAAADRVTRHAPS